jgi:hypothetical protein
MPDDKTIPGPADATRINIHQDHEIRYWTNNLGCTKAQLVACVEKVGDMADAVRRCLGK